MPPEEPGRQQSLFGRTVPASAVIEECRSCRSHDAIVFSAGDGAIADDDTIY